MGTCKACKDKRTWCTALLKHMTDCHRLATYLTQQAAGAEMVPGFIVKVVHTYCPRRYWMLLAMPKAMPICVPDKFLREIWLECCGHSSKFSVSSSTIKKSTLL
ncbi:hypothetical protein EON63_04105 [archaeon]|nr:MAG: hypothetical protein EON63_04105 [archaeon]